MRRLQHKSTLWPLRSTLSCCCCCRRPAPLAEVTQRDLEAVAQQAAGELVKRQSGGGGFWHNPFAREEERQLVRAAGWGGGVVQRLLFAELRLQGRSRSDGTSAMLCAPCKPLLCCSAPPVPFAPAPCTP